MKILTLTTLFPNKIRPNAGVFIKERMKAWKEVTNNELVVVAPVPWFPPIKITKKWYNFSQVPQEEIIDGIKVYHPRYLVIPKVGMRYHGHAMARAVVPLLKKLRETYKFDLIDAHFVYPDGIAAEIASKAFNVPFVVSARGTDINLYPTISKNIRKQIKRVLEKANKVIAVSQGLKNIMVNDLNVASNKVIVIGNGVDKKKFYKIDKTEARKQCNLPSNKKVILSVGSLIKRKNYIEFLKAVNDLNRDDLLLVIIGEGESRKSIEHFIKQNNMTDAVILKGQIPHSELKAWYSAADLFCLTSLREGWANVLMEALACGKPVIVTPAEGASEVVTNEDVGLITKGFAAKDIEEALNKALAKNWRDEAIEERIKNADWKNVALRVQQLFEELAGR